MPGLYQEYLLQKEVDAAPPRMLATQIQNVDSKLNSNVNELRSANLTLHDQSTAKIEQIDVSLKEKSNSIGALQSSQGTMFKDISFMKSDVSQRTQALQQQVQTVGAKVEDVKSQTQQLNPQVDQKIGQAQKALSGAVDLTKQQIMQEMYARISNLKSENSQLLARIGYQNVFLGEMGAALSKNVFLEIDLAAENVSKAELDVAPAGTFKKVFLAQLVYHYVVGEETLGHVHTWANFDLVLTPACDQEGITETEAIGETLDRGTATITVTFETGEGVSYTLGKKITCDCQVDMAGGEIPDDKWFGLTVAKVTKTYTVIA